MSYGFDKWLSNFVEHDLKSLQERVLVKEPGSKFLPYLQRNRESDDYQILIRVQVFVELWLGAITHTKLHEWQSLFI